MPIIADRTPALVAATGEQPVPSGGAELDRLLEAGEPKFPEDFVMSLVDGEQRTIIIGPLHQGSGDVVVVIHHETENSIEMIAVVEGRGVLAFASPDDRQPFAWLDELRADDEAGDEAVQLFEQHGCFAKGEEFFLKPLDVRITPVPGGVGPLTSVLILENLQQLVARAGSEATMH